MKFARVFAVYVFKYLIAFLLVFCTSVLVFFTAKRSIENYILERVQMQIQEGVQTVEETVDKLELLGQVMYQSKGFENLVWLEGEKYSAQDALRLRDSNQLLKLLGSTTDYIAYSFILFGQNNMFLSSTQSSTYFPDYYGRFMEIELPSGEVTTAEELKEILFESMKEGKTFQKLERIIYTEGMGMKNLEGALMYLTDGILAVQTSRQIFCFVLSKEYLVSQILTPEMIQDGFLQITNSSTGEILLTHGPEADEAECHITRITRNKLGWQITVGLPSAFINEQISEVQRLLVVYLVLGLVVVFGLAFFFSWNITRLDEKSKTYKARVDVLKRQNHAIMLENMMTRGEAVGQERFCEELFGKEPEFYSVIMVRFLQIEDLEECEAATVLIVELLQEMNIPLLSNVHSSVSDELFLIERYGDQKGNTMELLSVMEEIAEKVSNQYNCILHIGISTVGIGISNINKCYIQARQLVQSQYLYENENMVQVYDIAANALHENPMTIELLTRLYNMLISGRYLDAEKELAQVEGRYIRMPYLYEIHREEIFYTLRNIFYTVILHLNWADGKRFIPEYDAAASCTEMIEVFRKSAAEICEQIRQGKKSRNEKLKEHITEIIAEGYKDPALSAYSVSKKAGIAEKYLYQFWKEQTGETFSTYLLHVRIKKAKEYLEQTDYSNIEIAELTGFSSINTFYRNFQKLTGISPKVYKEKNKRDL